MEPIFIFGASGHAKVIIDLIEKEGRRRIAGFIDHRLPPGAIFSGYTVLGTERELRDLSAAHGALAGIVALGHPIAAAAVAIAGLALFLLGRRFEIPVVSALTEVAMGIVATGVGVLEAIAGRNYQTWAPPARG